MRQVFTSQRLETVEGVARLLEDAGIAVYISQPRSYHSRRSGQFSYSDPTPARQQPAVWVRLAEDQPRARELLRQAGLMETTRSQPGQPQLGQPFPTAHAETGDRRWAWRIRIGLMLVIAAVAMLVWLGQRQPPVEAPVILPPTAGAPAAAQSPQADDEGAAEEEFRVRITPAPADPPPR